MTKNHKKGFTIIEVVLVLAIAGLIFLMVFIALPALQRSQRNTRRRQDMARIITAINDYESNNGKMFYDGLPNNYSSQDSPAAGDGEPGGNPVKNFVIKYIDSSCSTDGTAAKYIGDNCSEQFKDPDGSPYVLRVAGNGNSTKETIDLTTDSSYKAFFNYTKHSVLVSGYSKCGSSETVIEGKQGKNMYVVLYQLEGGSYYCGDNQ